MKKSRVALLSASALVVSLLVPALAAGPSAAGPSPARAASPATTLSGFSHILVDTTDAEVFISEGSADAVLVTNTAGGVVDTIDGLSDPTGMVLSPDSSTVYVALQAGDGIEAIDTSSLAATFIGTGDNTCPRSVALAADLLWFTYGCQQAGLGAVDTDSGKVYLGLAGGINLGAGPALWSDPSVLPDTLVEAEVGPGDPGFMNLLSVVGGDSPSATLAARQSTPAFLDSMTFSADGTQLLAADGNQDKIDEFSTTDLNLDGHYGAGIFPIAVAVRADGMVATGAYDDPNADIDIFQPGQKTVYRAYHIRGQLQTDGLAFGLTKMFAVIGNTLHVIIPKAATTVTLTVNQSHFAYGATAALTAHLGDTYSGRTLSIYATPSGKPRHLVKTGRVGALGNLTASTRVNVRTMFTAVFAGDAHTSPAHASKTVTVSARVDDTLHGYYGSSGSYDLYHTNQDPLETTTVAPNKSGDCVYFHLQEYYDGSWTYDVWTKCIHLSSTSQAAVKVVGEKFAGERLRLRAEFKGGVLNTGANGDWRYMRFTS